MSGAKVPNPLPEKKSKQVRTVTKSRLVEIYQEWVDRASEEKWDDGFDEDDYVERCADYVWRQLK